ncbi:1,4-alpha-glucan branching protein GlgB [Mucilaginibacter sp. CSA2-8R]|uniref:1,4-alpha-glucan branching protein GlgB n=1 Tax=Mucilaginibacter sp. CSA2-8R TaxID=3141542 RepID=UPI00315DB463
MENNAAQIIESQPWFTLFTDFDIDLFKAGKHYQLYNKLGARQVDHAGRSGTYFAVWAPNAKHVSVIGNFNGWNRYQNAMHVRWDGSGIWELFVPDITDGECYKYFIESNSGYTVEKGDPYAYRWETAPHTATITANLQYTWGDQQWIAKRGQTDALQQPLSIYELHIGSWRRVIDGESRFMTYRELAVELTEYCKSLNFSHVEFMPVMEHPFYGSWGYQLTGYFAPSARYGTAQDFMYLVDQLHQAGIGVILDWVPSHFPEDQHGLGYFDGTHLYEYADPRKGFHPDWKSLIFNFSRNEVRAFLISNALYWLDKFHIDGLRVDAVASMLYLDYSRKAGEWIPNEFGGRENLEAISFLQEFNDAVHQHHPDVITIAEESTAWPGVTAPTHANGLGFDLKWMMGWMHDTLSYFENPPIYRSYHHGQITFSLMYAFTEKFVLPLSHDEVVYGKHSLINKMPGDSWQQFANLRLLYGYMYGHPGAKLIFMGGEFGQRHEWQHDYSLDWHETNDSNHLGILKWLSQLNTLYKQHGALYENSYSPDGFEWLEMNDSANSVLSWLRKGKDNNESLIFVANFAPVVRNNYRIGVSQVGNYTEVLNSDNLNYGGSDVLNKGLLESYPIPMHGKAHSLVLTLPPLGISVIKFDSKFDWL